jgi:toxin HigB-1
VTRYTVDVERLASYNGAVIRDFGNRETENLFHRKYVPGFQAFERSARRKLAMIDAAVVLRDLLIPPGNRLEPLKRAREGQHSIRINDKYRICFIWKDGDAYGVEITDYH